MITIKKRVVNSLFVGVFVLSGLCAHTSVLSQSDDPAMDRPNAVFVEGLGKGLLYSLGYERLLIPNLGVGVGFSYWGIEDLSSVFLFPVYISVYPITGTHRLHLVAGVDIIAINVKAGGTDDDFLAIEGSGAGVAGLFGVGYELRLDTGFLFRVTLPYFFVGSGGFAIWGGLSFGATF